MSPPAETGLPGRILAVLHRDTGRTDAQLAAILGVTGAELSPAIGGLYRRGLADRCGPYLVTVTPARPEPAARLSVVPAVTEEHMPAPDPSLLKAALEAARRGWPVFPLRRGSKRPAFPKHEVARCDRTDPWCRDGHAGWEPRATTDPGRIGQAWGSAPYNIGIATGPARLVVVDLDQPKPGEAAPPEWGLPGVSDGADVLAVLCERHGQPLPYDTYMVRTGRGGLHLYYTAPPGVRLGNTAGSLGWLIDTRAEGGYSVAAGSAVDTPAGQRGRYEVVCDRPPAALPAWLAALLTPATGSTPPVACPSTAPPSGALPAYAAAAVQGEADRVLRSPEHGHNQALNAAAFNLGKRIAAGTVSREPAEQALQDAGETTQPGEPPARIAAVIRAGIDAGIRSATRNARQGEAA